MNSFPVFRTCVSWPELISERCEYPKMLFVIIKKRKKNRLNFFITSGINLARNIHISMNDDLFFISFSFREIL